MSWFGEVRDAHERVRDVEDRMAEEVEARKADGRPFVEDTRYYELQGQMRDALSDRRSAWLGRQSTGTTERESER